MTKEKKTVTNPVSPILALEQNSKLQSCTLSWQLSQSYIIQTPPHVPGFYTTLQKEAVNLIKLHIHRRKQVEKRKEKAKGKQMNEVRVSMIWVNGLKAPTLQHVKKMSICDLSLNVPFYNNTVMLFSFNQFNVFWTLKCLWWIAVQILNTLREQLFYLALTGGYHFRLISG